MVWDLDRFGTANSVEFFPIKPILTRTTVRVTKVFDYLPLPIPSYVKLKTLLSEADTIKVKNRIISNENCLGVSIEGAFEVDTDSSDTIEKLKNYTTDDLKSLSLDYINTVVKKSKGVDKERAINVLTEILINAFDNMSIDKPIMSLDFKTLKVKNFLGLHKSSVDFSNPIQRITGTNGSGKTTNWKAVIWCLTGKITGKEKQNQKNKNLMSLKNRLSEDTDLEVILKVNSNSDIIKITRSVDYSKTKPVESIKIKKNGEKLILSEPQKYLDSLFNFEEINEVFKTLYSLEDFLKSDAQSLRRRVLSRLGIDAIENISKSFSSIKEEYLEKFPKPPSSESHYLSEIEKSKETISGFNDDINSNNETIDVMNTQIASHLQKIADLAEEIDFISETLDDGVVGFYYAKKGVYDSLVSERDLIVDEIDNYIDSNSSEEIKKYTEKLNILRSNHSDLSTSLVKTEEKLTSLRGEFDIILKKGAERKSKLIELASDKARAEKVEISEKIELLKAQLSDISNLEQLENEQLEGLKELWRTAKQSYLKCDSEYTNMEDKIEVVENQLCKNCGQPHAMDIDGIVTLKETLELKEVVRNTLKKEVDIAQKVVDDFVFSDNTQEKADIDTKMDTLEESLIDVSSSVIFKQMCNSDDEMQNILERHKTFIESITETEVAHTELSEKIKTTTADIETLSTKLEEEENLKGSDKKVILKGKLLNINAKIIDIETEYETAKIKFAEYSEKNTKIEELNLEISTHNDSKSDIDKDIVEANNNNKILEMSIVSEERKIAECNDFISQIQEKSMGTKIMNLLKKIVSGDGLPLFLFDSISDIVNNELAVVLEPLPFSLMFENGELVKVDKRYRISKIPVTNLSGMEIALGGIALHHAIDTLNDSFNLNLNFIDELSGALNEGTDDTSHDARNFRELYRNLLMNISKNKNTIFVDHVLKGMNCKTIHFHMGEHGGFC
jgi:DNA repair exonuclease SbcCD ATPase subunit